MRLYAQWSTSLLLNTWHLGKETELFFRIWIEARNAVVPIGQWANGTQDSHRTSSNNDDIGQMVW